MKDENDGKQTAPKAGTEPNHDAAIIAGTVPICLVLLMGIGYWLYRKTLPAPSTSQPTSRHYTEGTPRREDPSPGYLHLELCVILFSICIFKFCLF